MSVFPTHSLGTQERRRELPAPVTQEEKVVGCPPPRTPLFALSPFPLFGTLSWWGLCWGPDLLAGKEMWCLRQPPALGPHLPLAGPALLSEPTTRQGGEAEQVSWCTCPCGEPLAVGAAPSQGPGPEEVPPPRRKQSPPWGSCYPDLSNGREDSVWMTPFAGWGSRLTFLVQVWEKRQVGAAPTPPEWRRVSPGPHCSSALGAVSGLGLAGWSGLCSS